MDEIINGRTLNHLGKINVVLGKNGCGKSSLMRHLDQNYKASAVDIGVIKYLSPERGGQLISESNIFDAIQNNATWGSDVRRKNRVDNFRQMSMAEFRLLETLVLRAIEGDQSIRSSDLTFENTLQLINNLLDNVKITRGVRSGFDIKGKSDDSLRTPDQLSSGESELVSVVIEILSFIYQTKTISNQGKRHILLLDEPDVHLHPDLQARLAKLLIEQVNGQNITVFIATHSTAFLSALGQESVHVCFMQAASQSLDFLPVSAALEKILPIFGAHPLSNIFNSNPVLIVEGEDDERIWQQAVRSSQGKIKLWPCAAGDKQSIDEYEDVVTNIIGAVYDNAKAYSLRDRDDSEYQIGDKNYVIRSRLNCRAAENLILSDDVLMLLGCKWDIMQEKIKNWLSLNKVHPKYKFIADFSNKFDRRNADLKDVRLILIDLAGSNKPWEVVVGQAIAKLDAKSSNGQNSLRDFLGPKICQWLNLANSLN